MERLHQLLPKLYYSMRKYILEQARNCGLSKGQPRILDFLYRNDGCIQRDFCDEFSLEAPSTSNLLSILEKEGVLHRERTSKSSRTVNVFITEHGKAVQKKLDLVYDDLEEIVFEDFTEKEREQCLCYLERLATNMMAYKDNRQRKNSD